MTASNKSVRKNTISSRKLEANFSLHAVNPNAPIILAELKKNNESCRSCHYFCHSSTDERTCKDDTRCRLKNKPINYYNICHLHKKLDIPAMVENSTEVEV